MPVLPPIPVDDVDATVAWVREHLGDLTLEGPAGVTASPRFRGGQEAGDAALVAFDVAGYARRRNEVWPSERRGASALSPYVRHGLLPLPRLWHHVAGGPPADVAKYRDELLWQEYARHLYARLGRRLTQPMRAEPARPRDPWPYPEPWPREMACMAATVGELERDGWLVNQTRMWLSSQWTVRAGADWRAGEDVFYRALLDGSRAANRLGWQWTAGAATGSAYGFSRSQVENRAPGLCARCPLAAACPIQDWPGESAPVRRERDPLLAADPDPATTAGPAEPEVDGDADAVWLHGESLTDDDPALAASPDLPAVFVFDEPLLAGLRLSGKRLVFLAETLGKLAQRRAVEVRRGRVAGELAGRRLAVTFAPVPGFRRRRAELDVRAVHPWPWLRRPTGGPVSSFSAWNRAGGSDRRRGRDVHRGSRRPRPGRGASRLPRG